MSASSSRRSCAPWCADHDGQTCQSRLWWIEGCALAVSRRSGEPTEVDIDHPGGGGAYTRDAALRLSAAIRALVMLAGADDGPAAASLSKRLDALE